jgi:hypothetical protein
MPGYGILWLAKTNLSGLEYAKKKRLQTEIGAICPIGAEACPIAAF